MSNDKIMAMLNEKSQIEYYRFVAEDDEKCCDKCKEHNNKIFQEKVPNSQNWYHRHNGEFDNEKYINKKTGQEVVFNRYGKIITSPWQRVLGNHKK